MLQTGCDGRHTVLLAAARRSFVARGSGRGPALPESVLLAAARRSFVARGATPGIESHPIRSLSPGRGGRRVLPQRPLVIFHRVAMRRGSIRGFNPLHRGCEGESEDVPYVGRQQRCVSIRSPAGAREKAELKELKGSYFTFQSAPPPGAREKGPTPASPRGRPQVSIRSPAGAREKAQAGLGFLQPLIVSIRSPAGARSEERRVGKECRSRWSPYH